MLQPVQIHCVGEGPVVHVTPTHIDYGTIPVLSKITKTVKLSNESLIPAQFSCEMVKSFCNKYIWDNSTCACTSEQRFVIMTHPQTFIQILWFVFCRATFSNCIFQVRPQSLFAVHPSQGIIAPEDVLELNVTAMIDDTLK